MMSSYNWLVTSDMYTDNSLNTTNCYSTNCYNDFARQITVIHEQRVESARSEEQKLRDIVNSWQ